MAIHVGITSPTRKLVRLYRGEAPERLASLQRYGVVSREPGLGLDVPGLRTLSLENVPPDLIPDLAPKLIYEHVTSGSARSPFVSFTDQLEVARGFALDGGKRPRGLLIVADVEIAEEHVVEAHPTWRYGSFADRAGRAWIRVDGCNVGADAIVRDRLVRHVQSLGKRDAEYLVFGRLSPGEFSLAWVA